MRRLDNIAVAILASFLAVAVVATLLLLVTGLAELSNADVPDCQSIPDSKMLTPSRIWYRGSPLTKRL
ncbi:hypothetical protein AC628_05865 [Bradyrhizobium sp. NAS96.2]|nr:hypothetical protein AC628_05865 [Bradyrhizobium sp. NAS96.2]